MDARQTYEEGRLRSQAEVRSTDGTARFIALARLATAVLVVVLIGAIVWVPLPSLAWGGGGLLVAAFVVLVFVHARVYAEHGRAVARLRFHERGLDRLEGRWKTFASTGERFANPEHAYTSDLDVFGRASVFQLLDATETRFGEARLASWLAAPSLEPGWAGRLHERQAAVRDLATRTSFRERLWTFGALLGSNKPDPAPFLAWAEEKSAERLGPVMRVLARVLPVLAILAMAFARSVHLPRATWVGIVFVEILFSMSVRHRTSGIFGAAASREQSLISYWEMFEVFQGERFEAPLLVRLREGLRSTGTDVTIEMNRLARAVSFVEARNNEVFRIFIAPVLMWDVNCALLLEDWRARAGACVRGWFTALGEVEAVASLAGFAFDRAEHTWPDLVEAPEFRAIGLGHPLIAQANRVCNDVSLAAGEQAIVVTGSNMSGKSTLLRAMGINAVLALAGAPVCAGKLSLGPLTVATSMRVSDSLDSGVSRFYAELKKLKKVLDLARARPGTFFLLDEILHGTNSRERLIGGRAIIRELLKHGALGAVSTHDLAIGDLALEEGAHVTNVHFEEQVSDADEMTFDYRLRDGVVKSSNALRLMKIVGIDVLE